MLMPYTYDPDVDFLWSYRDEIYNYGGIDRTLKTPYAWNPNSPLYGYRRSLEGLQATRQTLSTSIGRSEPWVSFYTHGNPDTPNPYFWNSYPPGGLVISSTLSLHCKHCFSINGNINYPGTDSSFRNRYTPDTYLHAVQLFRFIDGDDVIYDYADIGALWTAIDDVEIFGGGTHASFESWDRVADSTRAVNRSSSDVAVSVLPSPFPYTPVKLVDFRTLKGKSPKIWVIDCNGKICDGYSAFNRKYELFKINAISDEFLLQTNGQYEFAEKTWVHDSGNRWFVELQEPTSPEAGDGILGWLGFTTYTGTPTLFKAYVPRLGQSQSAAGPTTIVPYSDTNMLSPDEESALVGEGFTVPTFHVPNTIDRAPALQATLLAFKNKLEELNTKLVSTDIE